MKKTFSSHADPAQPSRPDPCAPESKFAFSPKNQALVKDLDNGSACYPLKNFLEDTAQNQLPQTSIIQNMVSYLAGQGMVEAYLRGSFSLSTADALSDIDLFTVVEPANLEKTYESVLDYLEQNYPVIVSCWDGRVRDYGGIGFMFICQDENQEPVQLDLYFSMKGVTPKATLHTTCSIFHTDENYCWLEEIKEPGRPIPPEAQRFMDKFLKEDRADIKAELLLDDLVVNAFVAAKHIQRGQIARTLSDDQAMFESAIDLFKLTENIQTPHDAYYLADALIDKYKKDTDPVLVRAAQQLEDILHTHDRCAKQSLYFEFFENMLAHKYPAVYAANQNKIDIMKQYTNKKMSLAPPKSGYTTRKNSPGF